MVFDFIEKERLQARHLSVLVDEWRPKLPADTRMHVREGLFDASMTEVLDQLEEQGKRMAPAFVMIDPFGVKDMPMELIGRILANPKSEVYVTFMWEEMNRFLSTPEFETHLDALFGTKEWRGGKQLAGDDRKDFLHDLYRRQLKEAGAGQVVHFHLFKGNGLKYSIFFGTGHPLGADRMKKAIWQVAPFGDFSFRGGNRDQMVLLGLAQPDPEPLANALQDHFADDGWVTIGDVLDFVRSDQTIFHDSQVKKPVLKPMEQTGRLRVDENTRNRHFTYPNGCLLWFHPRTPSLF